MPDCSRPASVRVLRTPACWLWGAAGVRRRRTQPAASQVPVLSSRNGARPLSRDWLVAHPLQGLAYLVLSLFTPQTLPHPAAAVLAIVHSRCCSARWNLDCHAAAMLLPCCCPASPTALPHPHCHAHVSIKRPLPFPLSHGTPDFSLLDQLAPQLCTFCPASSHNPPSHHGRLREGRRRDVFGPRRHHPGPYHRL